MHENYILKVNAVILTNESNTQHHQWCGNECRSWRWWPKVGPPPNRQQNARRNEAIATQRYFWVQFSTMRAPAKNTINIVTQKKWRVTATQGITAYNSAPCGLLLKTLYTEWCTTSRASLLRQNAITLHKFDLLETVQTSRVAMQHSPTKSMKTAADN